MNAEQTITTNAIAPTESAVPRAPQRRQSDPVLTFEELRRQNITRCHEIYAKACTITSQRLAKMLAIHMGDVCDLLKSLQAGKDIDAHDIGQQISEAIICADVLCWRFGISLEDAITERFNTNAEKHGSTVRLEEKHGITRST